MVNHSRLFRLFLTLMLAFALCTPFLQAQSTSSSISVIVQDSSGAQIRNASVQVTNTATNARAAATADANGAYNILNLPPNTYELKVTATGFPAYIQSGMVLQLNQHPTVHVVMPIGKETQEVTVTADVNGLETSSSTSSAEVTGQQIENLPLNARDPYSLLVLVPGFSGSIGNDYNGVYYSINGGPTMYGDILVDGTPAGFPTVQGYQGVGVFPSVDAIGEFRLLASNIPAEYGRTLDGVLNVVFKTGSNQLRGTVFEFHRDNYLAANTYFNNRNHVILPTFRRNQFGGVLSGPIYKNKLFFLLNAEQLTQQSFTSITATVPTTDQLAGNFSKTYTASGQPVTIYDPFSTYYDPDSKTYLRKAYENNIIKTRLSTVGQRLLKYFPPANVKPSNPYTNANNYYAVGNVNAPVRSWDVRIDNDIDSRSRFFARYSNRYVWTTNPSLMPKGLEAATTNVDSGDNSQGASSGYSRALTDHDLFDVHFGFARTAYYYQNKSLGFQASSLALPSIINSAPGNSGVSYFPSFATSGYMSLGAGAYRHNAFMSSSLLSSLSMQRGKHFFKLGFDGRQIRVNDHEISQASGNFSYGTNWTQGPNANTAGSAIGNGFASLLVGMGTGQLIQDFKNVATESYYLAEYFQDDWHILPSLTLNLGVRYDYDTPRTERFNRMNYFDPNAASALSQNLSGVKGGLVYVGVDGRSRHQYIKDWNNFAPRVGLSWSVNQNTVIHAGSAIVYGGSNQAASGDATPTGWTQTDTWVSSLDGVTPYQTIDNPFPNGFAAITPVQSGTLTGAGGSIAGIIRRSPTPYSMQWNLDVQRQLPFSITTDIAYIGNRSRQLISSYESGENWDQLPSSFLSRGTALQASVANPFYGNSAMHGTLAAATTTAGQLLLPYPQFTSVMIYHMMGTDAQYDSLQLSLNKRMSSGMLLSASYVWAKSFDNNNNHQDSYNPKADYAISSGDIHQRFVASYVYQLPFGRGRKWGSHLSSWQDDLIGGWELNGITTFQGGTPLKISASNTLSAWNYQQLYANTNHQNAAYSGSAKSRLTKYFNTADFSQPAAFTLGNGPAFYNSLRAPGVDNTDFSIFKEISTYERYKLQLRIESFNIFNRTQFGGPDTTVTDAAFGTISSQSNSPRQVQFGAKLSF